MVMGNTDAGKTSMMKCLKGKKSRLAGPLNLEKTKVMQRHSQVRIVSKTKFAHQNILFHKFSHRSTKKCQFKFLL